jgi:transcriptional regulator with XRE-family HTH domain
MNDWSKPSSTSERLKEAMMAKNMKQADLARATGLSKGGISNYVTGRYEPKSDIISKLAKALDCSEMWLWGYDVPMERQDLVKSSSPDNDSTTEGEKILLDLFRRVPEDKQELVLQMIRVALGNQE